MNDSIQNILDSIEAARLAGRLNNDAARAASIALGLEGDDAMLANRLIAQGSDPASLEYVAKGAVSPHIAHAHRNGPGSLEGEERRSWLLLAALSTDESQGSTLRERLAQFAEALSAFHVLSAETHFHNESPEAEKLIHEKDLEIRTLPYVAADVGGRTLRVYKADLGFAAAYWSGAEVAAVLGTYNGEPYIAVGSNGTPLEELGITVDKPIAPCFGIIEDPDKVAAIQKVVEA
jgi:hypothetical protein